MTLMQKHHLRQRRVRIAAAAILMCLLRRWCLCCSKICRLLTHAMSYSQGTSSRCRLLQHSHEGTDKCTPMTRCHGACSHPPLKAAVLARDLTDLRPLYCQRMMLGR